MTELWRKYTSSIESYASRHANVFWVSRPVITLVVFCLLSSLISNLNFIKRVETIVISMLSYLVISALFILIRFSIKKHKFSESSISMLETMLTLFSIMSLVAVVLIPILNIFN